MLSSNQVRVRRSKNRLHAQYIRESDPEWQDVAERLLDLFRTSIGCTRGEIDEIMAEAVGDNPQQLVPQGLAKLLEDRCEFDVESSHAPDELRDKVFLLAARQRLVGAFDRDAVLAAVAGELGLTAEAVDQGLFADLKAEQRLISFRDFAVDQLLQRYNVALAQGILLRSAGMTVRINGETPARFRQLIRAMKFHRLMCRIEGDGKSTWVLHLDGPLSLFSSTTKYGVQLANFLPTLLQCKSFTLQADIRWGAQRVPMEFLLESSDGLSSHLADYGDYTPPELQMLYEQLRKHAKTWAVEPEATLVPLKSGLWAPDFLLRHNKSGWQVHVEVLGFWRRTDADKLIARLRTEMKEPFLIAVSEAMNTDENSGDSADPSLYIFKRTPLPAEIIRRAESLVKL